MLVEEWTAVFRGENRVNQNLCQRLWHGPECQKKGLIQPLSGLWKMNDNPQGRPL
jgi:hypothetical protein